MVGGGCEGDDVYLDGAIGIPKATLQTPVILGQKRQDRILIGLKVPDTRSRYSGDDHERHRVCLRRVHSISS
jgi:hypothetical protein